MNKTAFTSYALLGSGRVARHLKFYLTQLNLPFQTWSRNGHPEFNPVAGRTMGDAIRGCSHILFAVSDSAIAGLSRDWIGSGKVLVHFSGALNLERVHAVHPLMTFGAELESAEWYRDIPFIIDKGQTLSHFLPGFPNLTWEIDPEQRPAYHALCALAGNASFLLWREIGDQFEKRLNLPRALLSPFLRQTVTSAGRLTAGAGYTGPVARGDWATVAMHLRALQETPPLREAYKNYLTLARHCGLPIPEVLQ